jgi:hypothetical protein
MRQNLSYVSDGEVCVVGRGYGAWLAAGLLAQHKDLDIKCGILLNPIARWQDAGIKHITCLTTLLEKYAEAI